VFTSSLNINGASIVDRNYAVALDRFPNDVSLLPHNGTEVERALEGPAQKYAGLPMLVRELWNPETCPDQFLPWLAWALSVDEWDAGWSDDQKRGVLAASVEVHRHKGTLWSIRRALAAADYVGAQIIERYGVYNFDGTVPFDGSTFYLKPDHWAEYRVVLPRAVTLAQAQQVRDILASVAPARCHLLALDFAKVQFTYDAQIDFIGLYSYGEA